MFLIFRFSISFFVNPNHKLTHLLPFPFKVCYNSHCPDFPICFCFICSWIHFKRWHCKYNSKPPLDFKTHVVPSKSALVTEQQLVQRVVQLGLHSIGESKIVSIRQIHPDIHNNNQFLTALTSPQSRKDWSIPDSSFEPAVKEELTLAKYQTRFWSIMQKSFMHTTTSGGSTYFSMYWQYVD